MDLSIIEY